MITAAFVKAKELTSAAGDVYSWFRISNDGGRKNNSGESSVLHTLYLGEKDCISNSISNSLHFDTSFFEHRMNMNMNMFIYW